MAAFSDAAFRAKLKDLNSSQQSIQTISLWAIHHRKHCARIVAIWIDELKEAKEAVRKLTLLYFANDVIQNMRRKGQEYQNEFRTVMTEAVENSGKIARESDEKTLKSVARLVNVWRERAIFDEPYIVKLEQILAGPSAQTAAPVKATVAPIRAVQSTAVVVTKPSSPSIPLSSKSVLADGMTKRIQIEPGDLQAFAAKKRRVEPQPVSGTGDSDDEDYEEAPHVNGEPEAPKLETLLRLIQKLQSAPSANASIRSRIAELPGIITDPVAIDKLSDRDEVERLVNVAKEGLKIVAEYNKDLNQELQDRQAVATELARQLAFHRKIIDEKEQLREDLAGEISKRREFRDKLAIHVDSLPDMSRINSGPSNISQNGSQFNRNTKMYSNKNVSLK